VRSLILALVSAFVLHAAPALADDALSVELTAKAQAGKGQPELVVRAHSALTQIILDVKRSTDGRRIKARSGPILAGRSHVFVLPMTAAGTAQFQGSLSVQLDDGQTGSMPIDVQVELLPPLKVKVRAQDLDLKGRVMKLSTSRTIVRAQLTLMSDAGAPMGTTEVDVGLADDKGLYTLSYEQGIGTIMKMVLQVYDDSGFFGGLELFPWQVDIPHQEVNFASGQHRIDPAEVSKLQTSLHGITAAIAKFGKLADISLFVGGHTDSVGDAGSNQGLSSRRARAIAKWFRSKGVRIPVFAAGFGESLLLVGTPDETDEVQNRRAEYIVAVSKPQMGGQDVKWQRVK
jgi:outer membrane protein OmpA-like peptidoglycan-associated protein